MKLTKALALLLLLTPMLAVLADESPTAQPPACTPEAPSALPEELRASAPEAASTCTNCVRCIDDSECGGGSCIPVRLFPLACESFPCDPDRVCSANCTACLTTADCGVGGGTCIPVRQAPCIPICPSPQKACLC